MTDEEIEKLGLDFARSGDYPINEFGCLSRSEMTALAAFKAGFRACQEQTGPKWISVKERLPKEDCEVLALCGPGFYYLVRRDGNSWLSKDRCYLSDKRQPSHWMPLPEAPDVEGEE